METRCGDSDNTHASHILLADPPRAHLGWRGGLWNVLITRVGLCDVVWEGKEGVANQTNKKTAESAGKPTRHTGSVTQAGGRDPYSALMPQDSVISVSNTAKGGDSRPCVWI